MASIKHMLTEWLLSDYEKTVIPFHGLTANQPWLTVTCVLHAWNHGSPMLWSLGIKLILNKDTVFLSLIYLVLDW
jgi:hypothetical protein